MPDDDATLLRRYASEGSEEAFRELVGRHLRLVYSAALRRTGGDAHRAQDVSQIVFAELARKAKSLLEHQALSAWLYAATRNVAIKTVLAEKRRAAREQVVEAPGNFEMEPNIEWDRIRPVLDGAMDELGERDREAILLRFFEGRTFKEVAAVLQASEDSARMRVARALEKLRTRLLRHGVTSSAAAIGVLLADQASTDTPAGGAGGVSDAALSDGGGAAPLVIGAVSAGKLATGGVVVAILVAMGIAIFRHANSGGLSDPIPEAVTAGMRAGPNAAGRGADLAPREAAEPMGPTLAEILAEPDQLKAYALFARYLLQLEPAEFGRVFPVVLAIAKAEQQDVFHHWFLRQWGRVDPLAALAAIDSTALIPRGRVQTSLYQKGLVVRGWALEDPDAAMNWTVASAGSLDGDPRSPETRDRARRLTGSISFLLSGLVESGHHAEAARILTANAELLSAAAWASGNYGGSYRGELTDEIRDRSANNAVGMEAGHLLKGWLQHDAKAATDWLNDAYPSSADKTLAVAGLVRGAAAEDPDLGIRLLDSFSDATLRATGSTALVEALNENGSAEIAFDWLTARSVATDDGTLDAAIHAYFSGPRFAAPASVSDGEPQTRLIARIRDPSRRLSAARTYAQDRETLAPAEALRAMNQFLPAEELWSESVQNILTPTGVEIGHSIAHVIQGWTRRNAREAFDYVNTAPWLTAEQRAMLREKAEATRRYFEEGK